MSDTSNSNDTNDTDWDVEKLKGDHESREHWELRKEFVVQNKGRVPENRLICLSQCFANMEFLGCRYPQKTMEEVGEMSFGIVEQYREKQKTRIQRTFCSASSAAEKKSKDGSGRTKTRLKNNNTSEFLYPLSKIAKLPIPYVHFIRSSTVLKPAKKPSEIIVYSPLTNPVKIEEKEFEKLKITEEQEQKDHTQRSEIITIIDDDIQIIELDDPLSLPIKPFQNSIPNPPPLDDDDDIQLIEFDMNSDSEIQKIENSNLNFTSFDLTPTTSSQLEQTSPPNLSLSSISSEKNGYNAPSNLGKEFSHYLLMTKDNKKNNNKKSISIGQKLRLKKLLQPLPNPSTSISTLSSPAPVSENSNKIKVNFGPKNALAAQFKDFIIIEQIFVDDETPSLILNRSCQVANKVPNFDIFNKPKSKLFTCNLELCKIKVSVECPFKEESRNKASELVLEKLKEICFTLQYKELFVYSNIIERSEIFSGFVKNNKNCLALESDNMGMKMLKTMGWEGKGLGKDQTGIEQPIELISTVNRQGLGKSDGHVQQKVTHNIAVNFIASRLAALEEKDLVFSPNFTSAERKTIHNAAHFMKLKSQSYGRDPERFLVLSQKLSPVEIVRILLTKGGETNKFKIIKPTSPGGK